MSWVVLGAVAAFVLVVLFNLLGGDEADAPPSSSTAVAVLNRGATPAATASPEDRIEQQPGTIVARSSPPSPRGATPVTTPEPRALAQRCAEGCLVRIPGTEPVAAILTESGARPSYEAAGWFWSVVGRQAIARLETANVPVTLVNDTPETLFLYVTRLPAGERESPVVESFGTVLDRVDEHAIVRVEKVPARVADVVAAGIWVEKLKPGPPPKTETAGSRPALADVDLGALLPQVNSERIGVTTRDLQGMSSTDGTGVGTRYYTATGNVMAAEYLFRRLESDGLTVWYEDFVTPEGLLAVNVVGEIPGRDPSAIYGVLAHFDSISTEVASAPGADDNSTGVAGALEIARILTGYELEHPLRIVFVNVEEAGILGSKAFARKAVVDDVPFEGIFNVDSVGSDRQGTLLILNADAGSAWMEELMVRMNDEYGLGQEMMVRQNPAIVADDNKLREQGLEAVMVARELYGWSPIHHSPEDTIEKVSMPNTVSATQLVLLSVAALVRE